MNLLVGMEVRQVARPEAGVLSRRVVDFVGRMAADNGAVVTTSTDFEAGGDDFLGFGKHTAEPLELRDAMHWAQTPGRVLVVAGGEAADTRLGGVAAVEICMEPWQQESTLFAASGLADMLGDPDRAPLVPAGDFAAGTIACAAFSALCGVHVARARFGVPEVARVDGVAALAWVNWKAGAAGAAGRDIHRQGRSAEWPVLPCADGHVALVYTEREWPALVQMLGQEALEDSRFASFKARAALRDEYMAIVARGVGMRTKHELMRGFLDHEIPGAPVLTPADLLVDDLLLHRGTFRERALADGTSVRSPRPAQRVLQTRESSERDGVQPAPANRLPLAGVRVLDLGIITAGAGTSALLADLGADVIKVESERYPDPMRRWAGSSDSPLFSFNNRNKRAVSLDLKTDEGRTKFLDLAAEADLVIENFRRGVLSRLGLDFETLRAVNDRILLASISGQGNDGPNSHHVTYGSTLEALSGFSALTTYADAGLPYITGRNVNYPDQTICLYAAGVIAAAIATCRLQGRAMHIDISQRDVPIHLLGQVIESVSAGRLDDAASVRAWHREEVVQGVHACSDGRWIALAGSAAGLSGAGLESPAARDAWCAQRSSDAAVHDARQHGLGAARVAWGSELVAENRLLGARVFERSPAGTLVKGFPFLLDSGELRIRCDSPFVGQHDEEVLGRGGLRPDVRNP